MREGSPKPQWNSKKRAKQKKVSNKNLSSCRNLKLTVGDVSVSDNDNWFIDGEKDMTLSLKS